LVKGEVLRNLRTAQSSYGSTHYDSRQGAYSETSASLKIELTSSVEQAAEQPAETELTAVSEIDH
jgi:hypothetical protein